MSHKSKLAKLLYLTILCLFYCILCSHYPALAGEIKTVEIKMWEDYTEDEEKFLRARWDVGGVDSVVSVLERWGRISRRQWGSAEICSLFSALAGDSAIVPLKEWKNYTDAEKAFLRTRWTKNKRDQVVDSLKEGKNIPDFVTKLPTGRDYPPRDGYDLRRIRLVRDTLQSVRLRAANLQGASFFESKLQDADLGYANLSGATFSGADLQGANLGGADLQGANLFRANLQDAYLGGANLKAAKLRSAKLQHANLSDADLEGADMRYTRLQGANLQRANLQDADLYRVRFDSTYLWQGNLQAAKNIRYIIWGDSLKSPYFIGEEIKADSTKTYEDFRKTEITYRDLKTLYKKELMDDVAMEFHFRENEVRTKSYAWYQPGRLMRLLFLKWTYGYGSRKTWLLWYSLIVIGLFALVFAILTIPRKTKSGIYLIKAGDTEKEELLPFHKGRLFLDCLYFSTLSFATFGYGALQPRQWLQFFRLEPVEYKPVRWARIFVGIEAALGIWIFALLVTVLFGR